MSPEAITEKHYSSYSDIWSFGVLMIEVLTNKQPSEHLSNMDVMNLVVYSKGHHKIPDECPETFKQIIEGCFHREPKNRIQLFRIIEILNS